MRSQQSIASPFAGVPVTPDRTDSANDRSSSHNVHIHCRHQLVIPPIESVRHSPDVFPMLRESAIGCGAIPLSRCSRGDANQTSASRNSGPHSAAPSMDSLTSADAKYRAAGWFTTRARTLDQKRPTDVKRNQTNPRLDSRGEGPVPVSECV
jgi:hypothetical protein